MHIIQSDLVQVAREWNCHRVRRTAGAEIPGGIPDLMFFHPGHGCSTPVCLFRICSIVLFVVEEGYQCEKHVVQPRDIEDVEIYTRPKPPAVSAEFKELADVIVQQEGWRLGDSPAAARDLYIQLKDAI